MNFKKIFVLFVAVVMMLTMLTACKDDSKENTSVDESKESVSDEASGSNQSAVENTTADTSVNVSTEASNEVSTEISSSTGDDTSVPVADSSEIEDISIGENSGDDTVKVEKDTYTVIVKKNSDGTVTVTAYTPDYKDVFSGKLVIAVSDKLSLVTGSLNCEINQMAMNEEYPGGVAISFAAAKPVPAGCVALTATYKVADGANITAEDVTAPEWRIQSGDGSNIGDNTTKAVKIIVE